MKNIAIRRVNEINETQAATTAREALVRVWANYTARDLALQGVSQSVKVGVYHVNVFTRGDGVTQANIYTTGYAPAAIVEFEAGDLEGAGHPPERRDAEPHRGDLNDVFRLLRDAEAAIRRAGWLPDDYSRPHEIRHIAARLSAGDFQKARATIKGHLLPAALLEPDDASTK